MSDREPVEIEEFLARPLVARLATNGPTVRPVWFLWEDGAFWWITGTWATLPRRLADSPEVALVVDICDLGSGSILQVNVSGAAEVVPMDPDRATRKLVRYLGDDVGAWPAWFHDVLTDPGSRLVRLRPRRTPRIVDQSL